MKCLTLILLLLAACNGVWSVYLPSNYGQQQQLVDFNLLQKQIQHLQQQIYVLQQQLQSQAQLRQTAGFNSVVPTAKNNDIEYIPTAQGYRFSYKLADGRIYEQNAIINSMPADVYSRLGGKSMDRVPISLPADDAGGSRPKTKTKNRKLSPSSLRALAG